MIGTLSGDKAARAVSPDQRRENRITSKKNPSRARVVGCRHRR
jgi:hypothetical protein